MKLTPPVHPAWMLSCLLSAAFAFTLVAADRQTLHGHLPPAARGLKPLRQMAGTNELDLVIGLPLRNQEILTNLLREIYDPASANYHRYLTPGQFAQQFGPAAADYQKLIAFAEANGLRVTAIHPNRTLLDVRAPVSVIEKTLHLSMGIYQHPKEARTFYAPDANPSLDLGVRVLSIGGLDNFSPPRPMNLRVVPLGQGAGPATNSLVSGSGPRGFLVGRDFRAAYAPGVSLNGAGQSVGLFELGGYIPSDISAYETVAGIPHVALTNVFVNGFSGKAGDANIEVALDIDMTISMAPGLSKVIVYEGLTPNDILNRMATDNLAKQLSSSWTWTGFGGQDTTEQIFMQFAAQGQSFFQASGDDGAYCGEIFTPSDDPYVTVVGGTIITTHQPDGGLISETAWPFSSGGITTNYTIPTYQRGVNMSLNGGSTTLRNIPDVACVAQDIWVIANNGEQFSGSGTSAAAPLWAGFAALVNQQAAIESKPPVGFINPAVYAIGSSPEYGAAFHDIITGNNTNGCGPTEFLAVPGYDLCTGWGTPNGSNTINALLAPVDALQITPADGITFSGPAGGPFDPHVLHYFLTNSGSTSLSWTLVNTSAWLNASLTSGTLSSNGASATVAFSLNPIAENFAVGSYSTILCFTNLNNGFGQNRTVSLAVIAAPAISSQPEDQPVFDGATATFIVGTETNGLVSYQWRFDNGSQMTDLANGGGISGADGPTLTVSNASSTNVGAYSVIVSNSAGSATSSVAYLSLVPWRPIIVQAPISETALPGQNLSLAVTATGSKPLTYRWRENGTNLNDGGNVSGALTANLNFNNLTPANAGTYSVVVSNPLGSATSADAVLTIPSGTAPATALTRLYSFSGALDGANPNGLYQSTNGLLYGTTQRGGTNFSGTVFQLLPGGTPVSLYAFTGSNDGGTPFSTLVQGPDGTFYGTSYGGGDSDNGTIFRMTPGGVLTNLLSFELNLGDLPYAGLVFGPDSNLYGTAYQGGAGGRGTAFKATTNGTLTVLYAFTNGIDGGHIAAGLALGDDGNFYGTTYKGSGTSSNGVVYRVATNGLMTTLAAFNKTNGAFSYAPLVEGADGNFYGTTSQGGTNGAGNIFRMTKSGQLTNVHAFNSGVDGGFPVGGLLLAGDGNFYGTTAYGGTYGLGTAFRLAPDGTFATLAQFNGFNGANPQAAIAQGADGNLYGTTQNGGADNAGVIFRLGFTSAPQITSQPASQSVFAGDSIHLSVVVIGAAPLSYQWLKNGTNLLNGGDVSGATARTPSITNVTVADEGSYSVIVSNPVGSVTSTVASITITSSPPFFTIQPTNQTVAPGANAFFASKALGNLPLSYQWQKNGVTLTNGGNVSGVTGPVLALQSVTEGNNGIYTVIASNSLDSVTSTGAVLAVIPVSAPGTRLTTLYSFSGGVNGRVPNGLAPSTNGDLYGTTQFGGSHLIGTVFKMATNGGLTFLASLGDTNGSLPVAPVALANDGNWYGTTENGSDAGYGTVFRMTPDGTLTLLHGFGSEIDGANPIDGLLPAADGNLYGTSVGGGAAGFGNVFRIALDGTLTTLYSFTNGVDGAAPSGSVIQASDGNFYGMTPVGALSFGNVYRMSPSGALANVYTFKGGTDGFQPVGALVQGTDGNLYGTTTFNSISGFRFYGTIFRVTPAGVLSTVYALNGISGDGQYPHAGLVLANDGCFYGTTFQGGSSGNGTIFRVGPDGTFATLVSLDGFNDGSKPAAALIQGADGSLYGTTTTGGFNGQGTIFRLSFTSAPQIITPPASQTVFAGANVIFSVAVSGAPQLFYQWRRNGTNFTDSPGISGSASRVLILSNVATASAATYSVVVSNALGSVTSSGATLTVNSAPPTITRQPTNQTVLPGATVTMTVNATGNLPLVYQWRFDAGNISGGTNNVLILPNVQFANAGNYSVLITNNLGSITSAVVGLRVPAVLAPPSPANGMTLTWLPPYVLQASTNVLGPYADVPGATSPFHVVVTAAPQTYFRLRAPSAATLSAALGSPNGAFTMGVSGLPGYRYIVQASTNLASWSPIQTNPVPFLFTDPNSGLFPRRFYRTSFVP